MSQFSCRRPRRRAAVLTASILASGTLAWAGGTAPATGLMTWAPLGTDNGGSGAWFDNGTTGYWKNDNGAYNAVWENGTSTQAYFGGDGGMVDVLDPITLDTFTIDASYEFHGLASLQLGAGTFNINSNATAKFFVSVAGTDIISEGGGRLELHGFNTYSGNTIINSGQLYTGSSDAIPSSSVVQMGSGTSWELGSSAQIGGLTLSDAQVSGSSLLKVSGTISSSGSSTLGPSGLDLDGNDRSFDVQDILEVTAPMTNGGILKSGSGVLKLSSNGSDFTGEIIVTDGSLRNGTDNAVPTGTAVSLGFNTSWDLDAFSNTLLRVSLNTATVTGSGGLTITQLLESDGESSVAAGALMFDGSGIQIDVSGNLNINGPVSSLGNGVEIIGGGVLILNSPSTAPFGDRVGGGITISDATLQHNADEALPAGTSVTVSPQLGFAAWNLNGRTQTTGDVTVLSFGSIDVGLIKLGGTMILEDSSSVAAGILIDVDRDFYTGSTGQISGEIGGTGGLRKTGGGELTLTSTNTYAGGTYVEQGRLVTTAENGVPFGSSVTLDDSAEWQMEAQQNVDELTIINATLSSLSASQLTVSSSIASTNASSIAVGVLHLGDGTVDFLVSTGELNVTAQITNGTVNKSGAATLKLSNPSNFFGGLNITEGTVLNGADDVVPDSVVVTMSEFTTWDLDPYSETVAGLDLNGALVKGNVLTLNGGITNLGNSSVQTNSLSLNASLTTLNIAGVLTIDAPLSLGGGVEKTGDGRLVLAGQLSTSRRSIPSVGLTIVQGEVEFGGNGPLPAGTNLNLGPLSSFSGAKLTMANFSQSVGSITMDNQSQITSGQLTVNGDVTINGSSIIDADLNIGAMNRTFTSNSDGTINGVISGTGGLTKAGGGQLTLGGANTYTGNTFINEGAVAPQSTASLSSSPLIELGQNGELRLPTSPIFAIVNGQTLAGNGAVTNGNMAVDTGGTISPGGTAGDEIGVITLQGLTLSTDSTYKVTISTDDTSADVLNVTSIDLSGIDDGNGGTLGGAKLEFAFITASTLPLTVRIIDNSPTGSISGYFNGILDDVLYTQSGVTFSVDYDAGGESNDVDLTIVQVPEPAAMTILLSLAPLLRRRRA